MIEKNDRLHSLLGEISPLGFGGWALGGEYWGPQEHKDSVRGIHKALTLGINHFDTAPVYGKGRSEQLLGQQLKKIRGRCILATKAFYTTPEGIAKSLETSLKRLLTDYIDIFYIHWPKSGTDMRPGMELLEQYRREGRIRAIGVSNFSIQQIRMIQEAGVVDAYQGGYSILWPHAEEEILPYCFDKGIAFIPYGVLAQGLLTDGGAEKLKTSLPGFRDKMLLFQPNLKKRILPLLENIQSLCRQNSWMVENAVTCFTRDRISPASILLGIRNRQQAEKNFTLPEKGLPPQIKQALERCISEVTPHLPEADNMFGHKS